MCTTCSVSSPTLFVSMMLLRFMSPSWRFRPSLRAGPGPTRETSGLAGGIRDGSELDAALAGGVGERLDAPVVQVAAPVEDDLGDAEGLQAIGDQRSDRLRGVDVAAGPALQRGVERR